MLCGTRQTLAARGKLLQSRLFILGIDARLERLIADYAATETHGTAIYYAIVRSEQIGAIQIAD
jgi:hypothetical protein